MTERRGKSAKTALWLLELQSVSFVFCSFTVTRSQLIPLKYFLSLNLLLFFLQQKLEERCYRNGIQSRSTEKL